MRFSTCLGRCALWLAILCPLGARGQVEQPLSKGQQILARAAAEQKYVFLVFHKDSGAATKAMGQVIQRELQSQADRATYAFVNVSDPSEKPLVERFDVSRAPMPLAVSVAPNGAMTSVTPQKITAEQVQEAFVTRGMAHCMKAMQENKLLFVCVQRTKDPVVPPGVHAFCEDAEFAQRSAVMVVQKDDVQEAEFLEQLEIDPASKGTTTVLLAPPSVLVGKFSYQATKDEIAAALHEAGQCCDDPNCKHNHGGQKVKKSSNSARRPAAGNRRIP